MLRSFDASTWIHYLDRTRAGAAVKEFLEADGPVRVVTSVVAIMEVVSAILRRDQNPEAFLAAVASHSRVAGLTQPMAVRAGELHARLKRQRRALSAPDAMLLASAQDLGAPLWTDDAALIGQPGVVPLEA